MKVSKTKVARLCEEQVSYFNVFEELKLELTMTLSNIGLLGIKGFFDQIVTREVAAKHFGLPSLPFLPFHEQRKKLYECALSMAACHPSEGLVVGDMASELKPAKEWYDNHGPP